MTPANPGLRESEGMIDSPGASLRSAQCADAQERSPDTEISSATPNEQLPDVPADPWEATYQQSFAAELRVSRALRRKRFYVRRRDIRQLLHDHGLSQLSDEVVGSVRRAAREATGGNCAFADDDIALLAHLAIRAIDAGLTDTLTPNVRRNAERAKRERELAALSGVAAQVDCESSRAEPLILPTSKANRP